ncbi:MAG: stage III sporulation AC/AD family protein [Ruminococcus sp.]|nr:stage III sporulation AC/AD family protein [Ruminococcus sp.]
MVNSCFSVAVFCVCASIFAVLLRRYCTEQSLMIAIAACAVVMIGFVTMVQPIITQVQKLFADAGISSDYISLIFKALAVCFITQITCDICRDSGETAIASGAEIWGRGAITVMALPLIEALVETISDFL